MVEFWTDHLNIDLNKGDCIYLKPSDDRDVIRRHALGKFRDLIRASATSPAMLVYLDGKSNKVRRGSKDVPNENYARELLELHTLGVDGGYTQEDVRDAARCLSGWTFDHKRFFAMNRRRPFSAPTGTTTDRRECSATKSPREAGLAISMRSSTSSAGITRQRDSSQANSAAAS